MTITSRKGLRYGLMATGVALALGLAGAAHAQQPSSVNPTASSVQEKQLLDALKPEPGKTSAVAGRVSIPDKRSGNLIQPAGQEWRALHESLLPTVGMVGILGMLALIAIFFLIRGRVRLAAGFSGITITRFAFIERFAHWLTAISFVTLGLSGLNMTFGKHLIMPLIGHQMFSTLTLAGKLVHNYVSFAFALGVVLMFLMWVKDNIPHPRDILWIIRGGGLLGLHVDAARFNFGQKLIFWSVVIGGAGLSFSGFMMMFPFVLTDIAGMQLMAIVHGVIALVMIAIIIAHIYIGTLGMEGAFSAMGTGQVDLNWAREHHSIWAEGVMPADKAGKDRPKSAVPAE